LLNFTFVFDRFLFISEPSGESGLRVAGALEWGIFIPEQEATTKVHQIRKNTTKLDNSEHPLEVEYKSSPKKILCYLLEALFYMQCFLNEVSPRLDIVSPHLVIIVNL
jgi:hypothetical protein